MKKGARTSVLLAFLFMNFSSSTMAHEAIYPKTPVNEIEVKKLPEARTATAGAGYPYFDNYTKAYFKLTDYMKANHITTTVPVEADTDVRSQMRIYLGSKDRSRDLKSSESVALGQVGERWVVSVGLRGDYRQKHFEEGVARLQEWLAANSAWHQSGEAYAVYWDGPFVPGFIKRSEVHVPVERKGE